MESIKDLKKICNKEGEKDPIFRVYRIFSIYLTYLLIPTGLRANHISMLSILFSIIALGLFMHGDKNSQIIGAIIYLFAYFLDYSDGEIARFRQDFTKMGPWLDSVSHNLIYPLTFFAIGIGEYFKSGDTWILILGSIAGIFKILERLEGMSGYWLLVKGSPEEFPEKNNENNKKIKHCYPWKYLISAIVKLYIIAPILVIFSIIGKLNWVIYFYAFVCVCTYCGVILINFLRARRLDQK